jgi:hypothetical protein
MLVYCLACSSNLKKEATYLTSADFQRTTWRHIPEYFTVRNHRCRISSHAVHNPTRFVTFVRVSIKITEFWGLTRCNLGGRYHIPWGNFQPHSSQSTQKTRAAPWPHTSVPVYLSTRALHHTVSVIRNRFIHLYVSFFS